jgi:predicted ATPase
MGAIDTSAEHSRVDGIVASTAPARRSPRRRDDITACQTLSADELLADHEEFAKAIRQILTRLHDIAWLASHPLAVPAARARQRQKRLGGCVSRPPVEASFTPEYLGESLAERVRSAIRNLEPSSVRRRASAGAHASGAESITTDANGRATRWAVTGGGSDAIRQRVERAIRRATGMRLRHIDNQELSTIITTLDIGRSEYFRLQADGLTMVAELLRRAWDTSVRTPGDHAPAAPRPKGFLAVNPDLRTGNVTRFVGREREVTEVAHLASTSRLITVLGAPGAGKTRLELEVARRDGPEFDGETVVVSLAGIDDETRVLPAIGRAFNIYDASLLELGYQLVTALQGRRTLLVLDNFEHVLRAGDSVARTIWTVPHSSVIATSRVPLRVVGEQRYTLDPLPLPEVNVRDGDASPLQTNPAVNLFIDRAHAIDPASPRTQIDLDAAVNICRILDGLPLSIELAAARLDTLTAPAILDRLCNSGSLHTVGTGPRNAPPRHQTLHGAISWSRGLLSDDEARTLDILSAFVGGASLPAILSVATGIDDVDPGTPEALAAFDRLEALVVHNLVRRHGMADGSTRYGMLEAVRAYGLELLENDGTAEEGRSRHAAYFARQGRRHAPSMRGGVSNRLIQEIDFDLPDTRAALTYYLKSAQPIPALELVADLEGFWWLQGYRLEGFTWLERTLAAAGVALPGHLRARSLVVAGHLCALNGEDLRAHPFLLDGLAVARGSGERSAERDALHHLGVLRRRVRQRGSTAVASLHAHRHRNRRLLPRRHLPVASGDACLRPPRHRQCR